MVGLGTNVVARGAWPVVLLVALLASACSHTVEGFGRDAKKVFGDNDEVTDADLREIQELLNLHGYPAGPVDGIVGKKTTAAIRAYQFDQGLKPTGKPSMDLLTHLRDYTSGDLPAHPAAAGESEHEDDNDGYAPPAWLGAE